MPNATPAGANAEPNNTDPSNESGEEEEKLTRAELGNIVNSAVTAQLKRVLGKELAPAIQAAIEPLKKQFEESTKKPDTPETEKSKPNPELVALQKRLEDMQTLLTKAEQEKAQERQSAREDRAMTDLVTELTGKVRPGTERMVAKLLKADGALLVGDDGTTLKVRGSRAKGMPEEDLELPIADGVATYLKSKDAAVFLPAPSSGGAGTKGAQPINGKGTAPNFTKPPANSEEALARTLEQFGTLGIDPNVL